MGRQESMILDYLKQKDVFADLFNGYFFHGRQVIQPEMLQQAEPKLQLTVTETGKKSHSPTFQFIKRERDVVYSAEIAGQQMNLVICGLEHQTKIDYSMPLRTATLDLLEYLRQCRLIADRHEQAKDLDSSSFLSKFSEDDRLVPTVTLVFYTGQEEWNAALNLNQLYSAVPYREEFFPHMMSAPLNVLSAYHVEHTEWYAGRIRKVFDLLKYYDDGEKLMDYLTEHREEYIGLDEATNRLLGFMMDLDLSTENGQEESGGGDMCKAVEDIRNIGVQQGVQLGVQQGKQKGIQEIVLTMLKKGKTCEEISDLTDIPLETVTLIQSEG